MQLLALEAIILVKNSYTLNDIKQKYAMHFDTQSHIHPDSTIIPWDIVKYKN